LRQRPAASAGRRLTAAVVGLLLCLLLAVAATPVRAAEPCQDAVVTVTGATRVLDLAGCLWYLEDPGHRLTLADVQDGASHPFTRHETGVLNFGYTESAYWARFDLRAGAQADNTDWILELALPLVDEVTLYLVRDGYLIDQRSAGYEGDWSQRDLAVPNPTFRLTLEPGSDTRVYLRIVTANTFRLPITLWHLNSYIEKVSVDEAVRGLLLGSILAILAYNLFVAVSVRERSNIYYVLYLVSATVFIATEQVHGTQLLDGPPALLHKKYLHFQIIMTWFWGLLMARSLLETRERAPDLDQIIRLCMASVLVTFVLALFLPYHIAMEWIVVGSVLLSSLMIVVSYLSWRYYNPAARAYFFAWTIALVGFGVYALTVMGYLPLNIFTGFAPQVGLTGQIILFSFALADRIKQVQGQALNWSERALANLRRYQSLFDNAIEGVFQMSLERRFLTANPAMAGMLGFTSSREMIRATGDVLTACFADERVRHWVIDQLQHTGTVKGIEAAYRTHQGQERWATISLHTVYDASGVPLHLEGTCIDATERHQRQRIEKERENERMEKELARNSAEAKSQFLANMSHEIRTPLAAIIGYGENLLDPELDEAEKRTSAETVVRSGRHLLDLVNDILDHSKIDANKLDVDIVAVSLPELLDEIRAFFMPRAREKGLDFRIVCEYPLPERIQTDATRFRQIIINLCGNALKFTEKGSISLIIGCEAEASLLRARVVDTGIGMKPEQLARLFDPFAQGSAAIARQYGGTGLGLSISRRLAQLLGGDITVNSRYGEGSEFEVTIATGPLERVRFLHDGQELGRRGTLLSTTVPPRLRGRILCAEDNDVNRKLVSLLVGRTGATLEHVANGAEALEAVTREPFDLILMDIQMPVMNGRDAAAAIREAGINTPIIALTANVMAEDIRDYRLAGCNEHLAKPIDKARFYDLLARYLSQERAGEVAAGVHYHGRVLLVEGDPADRSLTGQILAGLGLQVTPVASGAEAVRKGLAQSFQLVLMARNLPDMDGVAATRLLRQAGFRAPVIAVTNGHGDGLDDMLAAGCDGSLARPLARAAVEVLLARTLGPADDRLAATEEDVAAIRQLSQQFLAGLGDRREALNQALAQRDAENLQRQAHQLKGTAGAMGYPRMTEQAAALEAAVKSVSPDWEQVRSRLAGLDAMIDQAMRTGAVET